MRKFPLRHEKIRVAMRDTECVEFLQWALPRLGMRWPGFRRVRGQVCKRLARRLTELGLPDLQAYKTRLEDDASEWERLDRDCRITISRFYRDRAVWDRLGEVLLPELASLARRRGDETLRCWSVGCASGEEPYTLVMVWQRMADATEAPAKLHVLASDANEKMLERARQGLYEPSSLRDLPADLRGRFSREGERFRIDPACRESITFEHRDVREGAPDLAFHLILCRNLVFTYYDETMQGRLAARFTERLIDGGALVVGARETIPHQDLAANLRDSGDGTYLLEGSR